MVNKFCGNCDQLEKAVRDFCSVFCSFIGVYGERFHGDHCKNKHPCLQTQACTCQEKREVFKLCPW